MISIILVIWQNISTCRMRGRGKSGSSVAGSVTFGTAACPAHAHVECLTKAQHVALLYPCVYADMPTRTRVHTCARPVFACTHTRDKHKDSIRHGAQLRARGARDPTLWPPALSFGSRVSSNRSLPASETNFDMSGFCLTTHARTHARTHTPRTHTHTHTHSQERQSSSCQSFPSLHKCR